MPRCPRSVSVELLDAIASTGRRATEADAKRLLATIGIGSPSSVVCRSLDEVRGALERFQYPLVAKVVSTEIQHKTEIGGVVFPLNNLTSVLNACAEIDGRVRSALPEVAIEGFLIEEYRPAFPEWLLSARVDTLLGPVVSFGLGGVHTELINRVVHRLAPLRTRDIDELIDMSGMSRVLSGYRGNPPISRERVHEPIAALSEFISAPEIAERVSAVEINPIHIGPCGVWALDAVLVLKGSCA